jgi:hypothetical protein
MMSQEEQFVQLVKTVIEQAPRFQGKVPADRTRFVRAVTAGSSCVCALHSC